MTVLAEASRDDLWTLQWPTQGPPTLCAAGVAKRWPRRRDPVLAGVDLELGAGEAMHISGRNGVGKTTFLRIVAGLLIADGGSVAVNGLECDRDRRAYNRAIGYLPAGDRGLYARLRVRHQLEFWARLAMIPRREVNSAIQRMLTMFDLDELAERRVDRLSMGQRQRVRLALTFLHQPELVLLDEPTTSLDEEAIALLVAAVQWHLGRGGAVVWCSPSLDEHAQVDFPHRRTLIDGRLVRA